MRERLSEPAYWESLYEKNVRTHHYPHLQYNRDHFEHDCIFRSALQPDKSRRLLELGAGGSIWLPYFAKEFGFEVYGIDYSKKGCEIAEENLRLAGVRGQIICGDILRIVDLWKGFFDVVVSFGVIEHFTNPLKVIQAVKECLRTDGLVITSVPNTAGYVFGIQKFIDKEVYDTHKIFSLEDLSNYHKDVGMQIILKRYLRFMDCSVLNYQNIFGTTVQKWVSRAISGMNIIILQIQKILPLFPQAGKLCASMVVIARNV